MKGIILGGGFGTRLFPCTKVTNKHLLPVYDKPMIYYPINTLVNAGIRDIIILTGSEHAGDFIDLLGNGEDFNANFIYKTQKGAGGIAEALHICKDALGKNDHFAVILGDNIFQDDITKYVKAYDEDHGHACVFLKQVPDPERFGVATINEQEGIVEKIIEKPEIPKSSLAVTGLYFYNASVWHILNLLKPSNRGELEITDVNNWYVKNSILKYNMVKGFWSDAGTIESLYRSATEVRKWRQ